MTYKSSFVQWPCFFHLVYWNSQKHGKRAQKIYLITFLQKQNIQSTHSIIYDQVMEISEAETLNILTLNICRHWKRSTSWPRCVQRILIWKISRMSVNISSGQRLDLNESKVFGCWPCTFESHLCVILDQGKPNATNFDQTRIWEVFDEPRTWLLFMLLNTICNNAIKLVAEIHSWFSFIL